MLAIPVLFPKGIPAMPTLPTFGILALPSFLLVHWWALSITDGGLSDRAFDFVDVHLSLLDDI